MATVTSYTAPYMESHMIVDGEVVGDDLILKTPNGTQINAGFVRGLQGYGTAEIDGLPEVGRPFINSDEAILYDVNAGSNKKTGISRFFDYVISKFASASPDDVYKSKGTFYQTNPNKIMFGYTGSVLNTVNVRNNADSADLVGTTLGYTGTQLTSVTTIANGLTITYTMNYVGANITSITKAVS